MANISKLIKANQKRWDDAVLTSTKFDVVAKRLSAPDAKARYQEVEKKTGVPWWFVAVVHEREASQRWNANIAQGDLWNKKSIHVPAGRGPFNSWEEAAVDALVNCPPYAARNKDWSPGGALTTGEKYNGLGYANRGLPSPYVWAGTNQYTKGKYVRDGVYDPDFVDPQLGCAGLLLKMDAFKTGTVPVVPVKPPIKKPIPVTPKPPVKPVVPVKPTPLPPEHKGLVAVIGAVLLAAFQWGHDHLAIVVGGGVLAVLLVWAAIKYLKKD